MMIPTWLIIFVVAVGVVYFLGLQSLSVNTGMLWLAGVNSLCIGAFNIGILSLVPKAAGPAEYAAYLIGGPVGIMLAMKTHPRIRTYMDKLKRKRDLRRSRASIWSRY